MASVVMEWLPVDQLETRELYPNGPRHSDPVIVCGERGPIGGYVTRVTVASLEETYVRRTRTWKNAMGRSLGFTPQFFMRLPPPPVIL